MKSIARVLCAALLAVLLVEPAFSQSSTGSGEGEVRRIDKAAGKITLRHGPLQGLDMPAMTMVFQAKDPALLDRLKVGDRVRFTVMREGGAFSIESAEPAS
jgi:Cu(I)/Ag(I) efflux system protein CusF